QASDSGRIYCFELRCRLQAGSPAWYHPYCGAGVQAASRGVQPALEVRLGPLKLDSPKNGYRRGSGYRKRAHARLWSLKLGHRKRGSHSVEEIRQLLEDTDESVEHERQQAD